ncbi:MAG: NAD(P)/FAD-dependent oxidoreductase [Terriglobales bacterium]|jgi:phytoene dehydrogenase-like protein
MPNSRDILIIGAGHNGLVAAFYLAKAGFKPLVLERRAQVGGAAITEEFHPGFRCSTLAHSAGPLRPDIVRDMQLARHGLKFAPSEISTVSLTPDGRALVLHSDSNKSAQEISQWSPKDAAAYADFAAALAKISKVIAEALALTPPNIDNPSSGDLWGMLKTGRSIRNLGKKDLYRVLRWGPMAVADLVAEFFDTEPLRATIAARGIFGTFLGPWSAGSALVLLIRAAADPTPAGTPQFPIGGAGAITAAMAAAAQEAGAEIRTNAAVEQVLIKDGVATAVVLANGEEIPARAIVSNADPRRTFMCLVDPIHLPPDFVQKIKNFRCAGTVAKINLALSALPDFTALKSRAAETPNLLASRLQVSPEIDYLERAFDESKYGSFSRAPYLEIAFPSLSDPSLAPAGQHVMSIYVQYAPFNLKAADGTKSPANWESQRKALGETVVKTIAHYAPDLPQKILRHQIITPQDLEDTYGLTGGHIFHGELALDQFFTMRPLLDWARYKTPIDRLFLCGSGTHPGTGLTGASGANAAREILKTLKK